MRLARPVIACLGVLAACAITACSSFGAERGDTADAAASEASTPDASAADAPIEGGATTDGRAGANFCPVTGAIFCSDFEQGELTKEWLPEDTPPQFLTLDTAGEHGHVLRVTLGPDSADIAVDAVLDKELGTPTGITYALDVRVDQRGSTDYVELASLFSEASNEYLAFHVLIEDGSFAYAEYGNAAQPTYASTKLVPVDDLWHRFEVDVTYALPIRIKVRVDGKTILDRETQIKVSSIPAGERHLLVGVNEFKPLAGKFSCMIDNVTVFAR